MAGSAVLTEQHDGVLVITFNRPERNNAWTLEVEELYFDALEAAAAEPSVRVIVVTGSGRSFCPGMDSADLSDVSTGKLENRPELRRPFTLPTRIPKPIVCAVNGGCAGVGLVQAMLCDVRFAAAEARFATAFTRRGLMAENGSAWMLARLVGVGVALDLVLSGRVFDADEASRIGLVNTVVPRDALLDAAVSYAHEMAQQCSPMALAINKSQIYRSLEQDLETSRTESLRYWEELVKDHPDFEEGVASFVERRDPAFETLDIESFEKVRDRRSGE